ncbi:acetate--CoA ligase family protein [Candidatus Magnetaquicoccus inordinatus]|uniref:acetate--CoA ligase family protein n=1 Tax=Candidatus Magnetaquicoccus inordinatus TaxID=2496818 RepID=UPI00102AF66A|nr:acetate--CoA ligase family protein [Candidatus Magnetaquicoccus inordinatus]
MNHTPHSLTPLLAPRALAIVGVSRYPHKLGHLLLANLLASGYSGTIHVINGNGGEILGRPVSKDLTAVPRGIDLVVLAIPAHTVLAQAKVAISRNCAALMVLTDGFRDRDEEGAKREAELAKMCRDRGVLLLGPNSLGILMRKENYNLSLLSCLPPPGGISLFAQSGAVCAATLDWMASRQLGLAKMVGLGNQTGVQDAQILAYLAHDPETQVIACHLEWVAGGSEFLKAAMEASLHKPVVLLLGGGSAWYTSGSLRQPGCHIHSPSVFSAACDRTGIIQTSHFQQWLDILLAVARSPLPNNNRVAVLSNGRGPGLLTTDILDHHGLIGTGLAKEAAQLLHEQLLPRSNFDGPWDLSGVAQPEHFRIALHAALAEPTIDAAFVVVTPHPLAEPEAIAQALCQENSHHKPILAVLMGGNRMRPAVALCDQNAIPCYPTPERAAIALTALEQYRHWRQRPARIISQFAVNHSRVRRLLQRFRMLNIQHPVDLDGKELLHAYGITVPDGEAAHSVEETLQVAERLGYPVSLHLLSPEIHLANDPEIQRVEVSEPSAVRDAYDLLTLRFARRVPDGRLDGLFVEKQLSHGRPLLMGMKRDAQFGPLLHVGHAHPLSLNDDLCQLAPITTDEALVMLRSACRLHTQDADENEEISEGECLIVAEVLQRISQLAIDFPSIRSIKIHPLIVRRNGLPPVATECEIELDHSSEPLL